MLRVLAVLVLTAGLLCSAYAWLLGSLIAESEVLAALDSSATTASVEALPHGQASRLLEEQPVGFVPNLGQWPVDAQYVARFRAMTVFLHQDGWTLQLAGSEEQAASRSSVGAEAVVKMAFVGGEAPRVEPQWRLPGVHHYLLRKLPSWRRDVPLYGAVNYRQVLPGVNLKLREVTGRLEFGFELAPDVDSNLVELAVEGVESICLDSDGALVLETVIGPLCVLPPEAWEESPSGERRPVACGLLLRGERRFGLEVFARRSGWTLFVEALIARSAEASSSAPIDRPYDLVVDNLGETLITGQSETPWLIASLASPLVVPVPGDKDGRFASVDAFVMRLGCEGRLKYKTFLGGTGIDRSFALAVSAEGSATIAGGTDSSEFPTTRGAFDTTYNGGGDAFVARLTPSGSTLVYSTFLGGGDHDHAHAVSLDPLGMATVTGATASDNFPESDALLTRRQAEDEFVILLDMLPFGVSPYGSSSPGCSGELLVSVTSIPVVGNQDFALRCSGAPPDANGGIIIGTLALRPPSEPLVILGAEMWVDPKGSVLVGGSVRSDPKGVAKYALPIPANPALRGLQLFAQFAWMGPTSPRPCPKDGISATQALEITVQ